MFLDAELESLQASKARLSMQTDLRRQVIRLEVLALGSRTRRALSGVRLGVGLAGKVLDFLRTRHKP
ncbi:MAG: hypothetical protein AUJ49_12450 [Desulfovibrionaceae bacterium CG1_02_65_16]|nr:MAG: hypothetical protein AUJ49_12450 [Desulfovibrionaceae bacterium CG1_02_65_16]